MIQSDIVVGWSSRPETEVIKVPVRKAAHLFGLYHGILVG